MGTKQEQPQVGSGAQSQYIMRIGHVTSPTGSRHKAALKLAEQVSQKTNGRLKIEVYPAAQLGDNTQLIQGTQTGTVQGVITPTLFTFAFHELFNVLDLPFLFKDIDQAFKVTQSPIGDELLASVESKGFKALAFWPQWLRVVIARFPADKPENFQGVKFRIMPAQVVLDEYRGWGASPVPTDLGELYNSLQQGVVDGANLTLTEIYDFKLNEAAKYLTLLNDGLLCDVILVNKQWFDSLPADLQKVLKDEFKAMARERLDIERVGMQERLDKIKAAGKNQVIELTPEQKKAFVKSVQPTYDALLKRLPEAKSYLEKIQDELAKEK
ncbi:TRAP transporter substrate-binding protein [Moorella stamsii]|nr:MULTISPECIES: TRAP transporter substrate-binding protein [Moorella]